MNLTSIVDKLIYFIAPQAGAKRIATRRLFDAAVESERSFRNSYEGADSGRLRGEKWLTSVLSTDAELSTDLPTLRRRSRTLYKDDYLGGSVDSRMQHVVGCGFTIRPKVKEVPGVVSEDEATLLNEQLRDLFRMVEPQIDVSRESSLWSLTQLIQRNSDVDGECFWMWSDTESDTGIPLAIDVIDSDRVETPAEKYSDPLCRMGVQRNAAKRIIGYWVRTTHPGDDKEFSTEHKFVPASRMKHVFKQWFAGQSRGLPWMTRVLARAKDGKDLLEAGLVANQIQNCWAVILQKGGSPIKSAMGAADATTPTGERLQDVRPGSIIHAGSNDTITFTNPPSTNSVGTLIQHNNRTVSAGLNWPYELTHGDWRGVSHAGGRIVLHGAKLSTRMDQKHLTERWLDPVWGLFVNHAIMFGSKALGEPMAIDAARFARRPWLFTAHECTPPRWDYSLNPREEVTAKLEAIDGNLTTLEYELGEDQYDLDEVLQQREYERAEERRREILPTRSVQVEMPQGLNPDLQPDNSGDPTE